MGGGRSLRGATMSPRKGEEFGKTICYFLQDLVKRGKKNGRRRKRRQQHGWGVTKKIKSRREAILGASLPSIKLLVKTPGGTGKSSKKKSKASTKGCHPEKGGLEKLKVGKVQKKKKKKEKGGGIYKISHQRIKKNRAQGRPNADGEPLREGSGFFGGRKVFGDIYRKGKTMSRMQTEDARRLRSLGRPEKVPKFRKPEPSALIGKGKDLGSLKGRTL